MALSKDSPIGIFDSGIGGLTVAKSVAEYLPGEHIIYFGDTARVPYGIKSTDTIRQYALQITDFLLKKNVKIILIACNSVAASAANEIKKRCEIIPVMDVMDAGCKQAVAHSSGSGRIGVIGTLATIGSGAYERNIHNLDGTIQVYSRACPLLVPLAEEGWTDNHIAREVLNQYLADLRGKNLDALILGCTHYPLFKDGIREILGSDITLIDSAESIAAMTRDYLREKKKLRKNAPGVFECYVSDKPQRFKALAERFLGQTLNRLEIVGLKG